MKIKYITLIGTALALAMTNSVVVAQSSTQPSTATPEIKLSPEGFRILCQNFPLNSRCPGGMAGSSTPSTTDTPAPDGTTDSDTPPSITDTPADGTTDSDTPPSTTDTPADGTTDTDTPPSTTDTPADGTTDTDTPPSTMDTPDGTTDSDGTNQGDTDSSTPIKVPGPGSETTPGAGGLGSPSPR